MCVVKILIAGVRDGICESTFSHFLQTVLIRVALWKVQPARLHKPWGGGRNFAPGFWVSQTHILRWVASSTEDLQEADVFSSIFMTALGPFGSDRDRSCSIIFRCNSVGKKSSWLILGLSGVRDRSCSIVFRCNSVGKNCFINKAASSLKSQSL